MIMATVNPEETAQTLYVTVHKKPPYSCCGSLRQRLLFRYAYLLTQYSVMFCLGILLAVSACITVSFLLFDPPDFEDPVAGFEPRGTIISGRSIAWNNLLDSTGADLPLSTYPPNYLLKHQHPSVGRHPTVPQDDEGVDHVQEGFTHSTVLEDGSDLDELTESEVVELEGEGRIHFCGNPDNSYARLIFESVSFTNLFTIEAIQSVCSLERKIFEDSQFQRICYTSNYTRSCCPSWNLGHYVTLLSNKSSCANISSSDVSKVLQLIRRCSHFYRTRELRSDCSEALRLGQPCSNVPEECVRHDAVFNILHFIVDKDFMSANNPNHEVVSYTSSILPAYAGSDLKPIYDNNFENMQLRDHVTSVVAIYFDIKQDLFNDYLLSDMVYPCVGVFLVLILMWIYIGSFFVTLMGVVNIAMSLFIAYFFYTAVLQIPFFPFMNLTSIILLVGIGADDTFVFCDIWKQVSHDRSKTAQVIVMMDTLNHAVVSMFVTSFTTASAFYANIISDVTSIQCFGIFSGSAILANFFLSVTWLPAVLAFHDTFLGGLSDVNDFKQDAIYQSKKSKLRKSCANMRKTLSEYSRMYFEKILPFLVIKPRFLWLILQGSLLLCGFVLIFVTPKLQLPSLPEFQLFQKSHPFEKYDFVFKNKFWFESYKTSSLFTNLPVTIVWGVKGVDNGHPLDPEDYGTLDYDGTFNPAQPDSQVWLLEFCQHLRNQSFYKPSPHHEIENCFIETFKYWMDHRDCIEDGKDVSPCCKNSTFPYKVEDFNTCLVEAISVLYREFPMYFDKWKPGPRFGIEKDEIKAVIVQFTSQTPFSYSYEELQKFWTEVESWVSAELEKAPTGMQGGWFISDLDFYDLQENLASGTPIALTLSVVIALIVMFLTTQNICISSFAILTISGTICVTIGMLVLLQWQLNILESVILCVAVGLSIDFTVHYGVAYSFAPESDRESRVVFSLSRMGSAISMAALTTFVAGAMMLPASILSYTQMGTFLIIVMSVSWFYSTFFFQSLCRVGGPEKQVGGFSWLCQRYESKQTKSLVKWEEYEKLRPSSRSRLNDESELSISCHSTTAMHSTGESLQELDPPTEHYSNSGYERRGIDCILIQHGITFNPILQIQDSSLRDIVKQNLKSSTKTSAMHCYDSYSNPEPFQNTFEFPSNDMIACLAPSTLEGVSDTEEPALVPNEDPSIPDVWIRR